MTRPIRQQRTRRLSCVSDTICLHLFAGLLLLLLLLGGHSLNSWSSAAHCLYTSLFCTHHTVRLLLRFVGWNEFENSYHEHSFRYFVLSFLLCKQGLGFAPKCHERHFVQHGRKELHVVFAGLAPPPSSLIKHDYAHTDTHEYMMTARTVTT